MSDRVSYVDDVLGFSFEKGTFRERFEELGCPEPDLEIWYRNALVYSTITQNRRPREAERIRLLTMIEAVRDASTLRDFAKTQSQSVKDAFNACVEQVARFRTRHLEYAASYINKQASSGAGNDTDVGTGGTPFMKYLKKHRDENRAQTI